jgi:hypothetical protein
MNYIISMSNKTFWYQYKDSTVSYLQFTVKSNKLVHIKGPLGLSQYIDNDLDIELARTKLKLYIKLGYHLITKDIPNSTYFSAITYGN